MFVHAVIAPDFLTTAEALNNKAGTLHLNMLLQILQHRNLWHGVACTLMNYLDLPKHLSQKLVAYLLIDRLDNFNPVSTIIPADTIATWSAGIVAIAVV